VNDDYAPDMLQFEKDFLNDCIIYHCCHNDKMIQLPPLSEVALQGIKDFQSNNLMQQLTDTQIAPSLMLEVMCTFMENLFSIQRSTIPHSGQGLFLRPNQTIPQGALLPYPGVIVASTTLLPNQLSDNDKMVCLQRNIYLDGSHDYFFPLTGNRYPPYLSMANEKICRNIQDLNPGKIIDCGMVLFDRVPGSSTTCTEIFTLYSPISNTSQSLRDEPSYRTEIKRQVLLRLFEHLDDTFMGIHCYVYDNFNTNLRSAFRRLQRHEVDINTYRQYDKRYNGPDRIITRYIQACVAAVDGRFLHYMKTLYPSLANDLIQKVNLPINFNHPTQGSTFLPVAVLIHAHSWFYYGNFHDSTCQQSGINQGHANHRHMIMYMVNHGTIIPSTKRLSKLLLQEGIQGFSNPHFSVEISQDDDNDNDSTSISSSSDRDDDPSNNDDDDGIDDVLLPRSSPVPPSTFRSSPATVRSSTLLSNVVPDVPQLTNRVPVSASIPTIPQQQPYPSVNRHEKAESVDEVLVPFHTTPLTQATQRDHVKQDVKSLLHELCVLPIAPRYKHQQQYRRDRDRPKYDDHSRSSSSYHRSFFTVELEPGIQDYDPNTLPNTIQEALRWKGTNNKSYTHYLSHPLGRLSQHHVVKNSLDINSQSTLYNDVMILTTILLTFWSVEVANFHRVDRTKNDFSLNDRAKIQVFGETYDGSSCLYSYTGRLLQHFSQHRLPYVHLYDILSKGTDLKGKAYTEWQEQVDSANSSLVQEDITQLILRAPSLHCYQMRSIAEMIVDLIVFRVLIFGQIKNKESIKNDLNKLKLVSNIPSVTYDGILKLSQTII
jgi:hypothetical protein